MKPATILLIDDEPDLLIGLEALLRRAGYDTCTANNSKEGMRLAQTRNPDLILCDVMMPAPNGWELRTLLSENPQTASIPFIFLTARTQQNDKNTGLSIGADDYITKPFDRKELLLRIEAVLRRQNLARRAGRQDAQKELEKFKTLLRKYLAQNGQFPLDLMLETFDTIVKRSFETAPERTQALLADALENPEHMEAMTPDLAAMSTPDHKPPLIERDPIDIQVDFIWPIQELVAQFAKANLELHLILEPDTTNWASVFNSAITANAPRPKTRIAILAPRIPFTQSVLAMVRYACESSPPIKQIFVNLAYNGAGGCIFTVTRQGPVLDAAAAEQLLTGHPALAQAARFAQELDGHVEFLETVSGCRLRMTLPPRK